MPPKTLSERNHLKKAEPPKAQHFVALENFTGTVNGRPVKYLKGYGYCAREGRKWDDLRGQLPGWAKEGKVELVAGPRTGLAMAGAVLS